ncbi:baeRF3 domain-containing protein [Gemmata sp.]|uniref:baeRF3 domain-containing protein n=1 Tax=Gemmata sp. TaxID=1914242 RepID=UPI003F70A0D0
MRTPTTPYVLSILAAAETPCVSVYLPATGQHEARYRQLVDLADAALARDHPGPAGRDLVDRLRGLSADRDLWAAATGGVVVLASPARFDTFALPRAVPERVEVGDSFHVKPLLRYVQSADPFHVLCVSRERVGLFEGNRYELHPLHVPEVPLTFNESLGEETVEPVEGVHTAQPESTTRPNARVGGEDSHGKLIGKAHAARVLRAPEVERFFREVDREVVHRVSEPSGLPLILVGIDDNLSTFRRLTKNRFVTAEGVSGDWTKWTLPEIRDAAWAVFQTHYLEAQAKVREDFGAARAHGRGTEDLAQAALAAVEGRVGVLLVDADRTHPGAIDMATGSLRPQAGGDTAAGDMLDDLAEMALKTKARVIVTPSANMPTDTGLAAIFRY